MKNSMSGKKIHNLFAIFIIVLTIFIGQDSFAYLFSGEKEIQGDNCKMTYDFIKNGLYRWLRVQIEFRDSTGEVTSSTKWLVNDGSGVRGLSESEQHFVGIKWSDRWARLNFPNYPFGAPNDYLEVRFYSEVPVAAVYVKNVSFSNFEFVSVTKPNFTYRVCKF